MTAQFMYKLFGWCIETKGFHMISCFNIQSSGVLPDFQHILKALHLLYIAAQATIFLSFHKANVFNFPWYIFCIVKKMMPCKTSPHLPDWIMLEQPLITLDSKPSPPGPLYFFTLPLESMGIVENFTCIWAWEQHQHPEKASVTLRPPPS